MQSMPGGLSRG